MAETGFLEILNSAFKERTSRKRSYSLRAFARDLELDPSYLSKVLRGKIDLGEKLVWRLGGLIDVPANQLKVYAEHARQKELETSRGHAENIQKNFVPLPEDLFHVFTDWRYYAILEAMTLSGVHPTTPVLADCLNQPVPEVEEILTRLERVKMVAFDSVTRVWSLRDSGETTTTHYPGTNDWLKAGQATLFKKALEAIYLVPIEQRDHSCMTMAIDSRLLPEAKKRIKQFRRSLDRYLTANSKKKDRVYNLSIGLIPLSKEPPQL